MVDRITGGRSPSPLPHDDAEARRAFDLASGPPQEASENAWPTGSVREALASVGRNFGFQSTYPTRGRTRTRTQEEPGIEMVKMSKDQRTEEEKAQNTERNEARQHKGIDDIPEMLDQLGQVKSVPCSAEQRENAMSFRSSLEAATKLLAKAMDSSQQNKTVLAKFRKEARVIESYASAAFDVEDGQTPGIIRADYDNIMEMLRVLYRPINPDNTPRDSHRFNF